MTVPLLVKQQPGLEKAQLGSVSRCRGLLQVLPSSFETAALRGVRLPKCDAHFGSYLLAFQIRSRSPVEGILISSGHDSGASTPSDAPLDQVLPPSFDTALYTVPSCVRMTMSTRLSLSSSTCGSIAPRFGRSTQLLHSVHDLPPSSLKRVPA